MTTGPRTRSNNSSTPFNTSTRVPHGDALSAALHSVQLNMALEGIVEKGNIVYKSKHICAYTDIVLVITRTKALK